MTATFAKEMRKKYNPKKHVEEKDEPIKKPPNPLLDGLKAMAGWSKNQLLLLNSFYKNKQYV